MKNPTLSQLSDAALVAAVERLARTEHDATLALVAHLAELGARRLYLAAGFSSLFAYCREVLALSEGEAYNRVVAARAVRKFPLVLDRLADGSVNLTTIRLLFKHLTVENHGELLDASARKSKRDVERLVASRFPQPAVPFFSVRKVPASPARVDTARSLAETSLPRTTLIAAPALETSSGAPEVNEDIPDCVRSADHRAAAVPDAAPAASAAPIIATTPAIPATPTTPITAGTPVTTRVPSHPARPATVHPTAEDQYSVRFTATAATWEMLQAAQDLLRHSLPNGDVSEIVGRALRLLLDELARKKFGATLCPRASRGTKPGSRDIPNAVKRAVWVRDCARCAFVSTSGRRCAERGRLEFHHVHPYAAGGEATVQNIQLRCRAHNAYEAALFYGPIREASDTVCEAIPGWDVSPALSRRAVVPGPYDANGSA